MPLDESRRYIGRRVSLSWCVGTRKPPNGEREEFTAVLVGEFTPERATRKLSKGMHDPSIVIDSVEFESNYYRMDLYKFMELAEIIKKE